MATVERRFVKPKMNTFLLFAAITGIALFSFACSSTADNTPTPDPVSAITVSDSWVRPGIDPTAIYLTISNSGSQTVTLTGVDASWADEIAMHETVNDDGFLMMVHMPSISILAGSSVTFEPGGMHLMAQDVHNTISEGDTLELALLTADGTRISFSAVARGAIDGAMTDNMSHDSDADDPGSAMTDVEMHGSLIASGTIPPQKSFAFTFDHSLTGVMVPYHNHIDSSIGSVMVKESAEISGATTVTIDEDGFHPAELLVAPGTVVTWINTTDVAWTVINGFPPE